VLAADDDPAARAFDIIQMDMRLLRNRITTIEAQNDVILKSQQKILAMLNSNRAELIWKSTPK